MLLPLIEGCEQGGWKVVIKFEGGGGIWEDLKLKWKTERIDEHVCS